MVQTQSDFTVGWQVSLLSSEISSASGENVTYALMLTHTHTQNTHATSLIPEALEYIYIFLARPIQMCLKYSSKINDCVCQEDPGENSPHLAAGPVAEGSKTDLIV